MTEYKYNTIQIRILFGFPKLTKYKYKCYSASQKWPNTNTNIIRFPRNDRIRIQISFGIPIMTKYEYHWASQKWSNTIQPNTNFVELPKRKPPDTCSESYKVMLNLPSPLMTETNFKCKQLPIHMTHSCDSGIWGWITVAAHRVFLAALCARSRKSPEYEYK